MDTTTCTLQVSRLALDDCLSSLNALNVPYKVFAQSHEGGVAVVIECTPTQLDVVMMTTPIITEAEADALLNY